MGHKWVTNVCNKKKKHKFWNAINEISGNASKGNNG